MQTLTFLQQIIHRLETTAGLRYLKMGVFALGCLALLIRYDIHCYQNMSVPAAMDAAQLARNVSEGRGYTTQCVRPLSIYLTSKQHHDAGDKDPARLNGNGHPDISNAPLYPVVLAGVMKVLPFHFDAGLKGSFWSRADPRFPGGRLGRTYQPDFLITLFNQFLFFGTVALVFFWARRIFDSSVAGLSAIMMLLAEVLWRFSASGLSTMFLMLLLMVLVWCLTLWESEAREPKWGVKGLVLLSLAAGMLAGLGGLTRYSFIGMIVPVVVFFAVFGGQRRIVCCLAALVAFAIVLMPWIARNYEMSGTAFGTASYNLVESFSPRIERSLQPDLPQYLVRSYLSKVATDLVPALQEGLFKTDGGWLTAFFVVGLMVGFRSVGLRRLRYFAVGCIAMFAIIQALVHTQTSIENPEINSENLLVLLSPMIIVFGVGVFYTLLENVKFPFFQLRYVVILAFVFLLRLQLWSALLFSGNNPLAYPPYRPDIIQFGSHLMTDDELIMSDIPWAVAWYGDRQCVGLTLNATADQKDAVQWQESFFAINDVLKPIHALYLTQYSLNGHFQTEMLMGPNQNWGHFIALRIVAGKYPPGFPLINEYPGLAPDQLLLCDRVRW